MNYFSCKMYKWFPPSTITLEPIITFPLQLLCCAFVNKLMRAFDVTITSLWLIFRLFSKHVNQLVRFKCLGPATLCAKSCFQNTIAGYIFLIFCKFFVNLVSWGMILRFLQEGKKLFSVFPTSILLISKSVSWTKILPNKLNQSVINQPVHLYYLKVVRN